MIFLVMIPSPTCPSTEQSKKKTCMFYSENQKKVRWIPIWYFFHWVVLVVTIHWHESGSLVWYCVLRSWIFSTKGLWWSKRIPIAIQLLIPAFGFYPHIYLMKDILHHLRCRHPCKSWEKLPINWNIFTIIYNTCLSTTTCLPSTGPLLHPIEQ